MEKNTHIYIYMSITESLCCIAETNTTFHILWRVEIIKAWCQLCFTSTGKPMTWAMKTNITAACSTWGRSWPLVNILLKLYQGCILSPCLFKFYAEYIMQNARLDESQAGIKITGRNINHLRYA